MIIQSKMKLLSLQERFDLAGKWNSIPKENSEAQLAFIEQNQLWRDAFYWLAWQNRILELRDVQLIGHNSYEQIRATLLSMIDWNEELRSRIGVMNYIHQRTRISRSVVAEVLAALRKGGYIEMNKGKLVAINRLPSEY